GYRERPHVRRLGPVRVGEPVPSGGETHGLRPETVGEPDRTSLGATVRGEPELVELAAAGAIAQEEQRPAVRGPGRTGVEPLVVGDRHRLPATVDRHEPNPGRPEVAEHEAGLTLLATP